MQSQLELENATYSDILQADVPDAYQYLTLKNIILWNWFVENCFQADFVLKMDSDMFLNPFRFTDLIENLHDKQKDLSITGFVFPGELRKPIRDPQSKFYIPKDLYESGTVF